VNVPVKAHVTQLRMTAGYTKRGPRGDYFTMNPRVRRVRVERDGARVGEWELAPSRRDLQVLPVQGPGGRYRITIVDVVPGSRSSWRETCVSELEVMGTTQGLRSERTAPAVRVADVSNLDLDQRELEVDEPVASPEAWCAQRIASKKECAGGLESCWCGAGRHDEDGLRGLTSLTARVDPILDARLVGHHLPANGPRCDLLIRTKAGWFGVAEVETCGVQGAGSVHEITVDTFEVTRGRPRVLRLEWKARTHEEGESDCAIRRRLECTTNARLFPTCIVRDLDLERCVSLEAKASP
jgi:hypothetical protein